MSSATTHKAIATKRKKQSSINMKRKNDIMKQISIDSFFYPSKQAAFGQGSACNVALLKPPPTSDSSFANTTSAETQSQQQQMEQRRVSISPSAFASANSKGNEGDDEVRTELFCFLLFFFLLAKLF